MARGRQLSQLVSALQAETGLSLLPASGTSSYDHRVQIINRVQARLYSAWEWDFAFVKRDLPVVAGDRFLSFPVDLDFERIQWVAISSGTNSSDWRQLGYGIGEGAYRSTAEGDQGNPQRWGHSEGSKLELWPVADGPYRVRVRGALNLPLLVQPSDRAILDDTLIVLTAAAELLKRAKLGDWEDKQREAQLHFTRLRGQVSGNKRAPFVNGGGVSGLIGDVQPRAVRGIDYIEP
jgi:hypothetical protein